MKTWICERLCRARKTILVRAKSRKEAQEILDDGGGEDIDMDYYFTGRGRVVRKDKERPEA